MCESLLCHPNGYGVCYLLRFNGVIVLDVSIEIKSSMMHVLWSKKLYIYSLRGTTQRKHYDTAIWSESSNRLGKESKRVFMRRCYLVLFRPSALAKPCLFKLSQEVSQLMQLGPMLT
jgi:hypothetical protein